MISWNNLDTSKAYQKLYALKNRVKLKDVMQGESGAERVRAYSVPMACGMTYHYASKQVDDVVLEVLRELAEEMQLAEKFQILYEGEVVNL